MKIMKYVRHFYLHTFGQEIVLGGMVGWEEWQKKTQRERGRGETGKQKSIWAKGESRFPL